MKELGYAIIIFILGITFGISLSNAVDRKIIKESNYECKLVLKKGADK